MSASNSNIENISVNTFLSALREMELQGRNIGTILPIKREGEEAAYTWVRGSEVLSKEAQNAARRSLKEMGELLKNLGENKEKILLSSLTTILEGNPKLQAIREKIFAPENEAQEEPVSLTSLEDSEKSLLEEEYQKTLTELLDAAKSNLEEIPHLREKLGERKGAEKLLEQLIHLTPGDFFISYEDHTALSEKHSKMLGDYLVEQGLLKKQHKKNPEEIQKAKEQLTLQQAEFFCKRFNARIAEIKLSMKRENKPFPEEESLDPYQAYREKMEAKIFPTLEKLHREGKIEVGTPIYIVQPGNNDIRNNIQVKIVYELVSKFLQDKDKDIPVQIHILGLGGHPTTGSFVAHIEVMTPKEKCNYLQELSADDDYSELIFQALNKSAEELTTEEAKTAAKNILKNEGLSLEEKLKELLTNDLTRPIPIFNVLENFIENKQDKEKSIKLFKGVSEAETHKNLMRIFGDIPEDVIHIDKESRDTGQNIANFVAKLPIEGEKPIIFVMDAYRIGRQVFTFSKQMVERSSRKKQNWSYIIAPLLDLPLSYYQRALTEEQLYMDVATLFAELARRICYPIIQGYVDPTPIDPELYELLAQYYSKIVKCNLKKAKKTPLNQIFETVVGVFSRLENFIRPGYEIETHEGYFERALRKSQLRFFLKGGKGDPQLNIKLGPVFKKRIVERLKSQIEARLAEISKELFLLRQSKIQ